MTAAPAPRYEVVAVLGQSNAHGQNTDGDPDGADALGPRVDVFAASGPDARRIVPAREPFWPLTDAHGPKGVGPGGAFVRRLLPTLPADRRVLLVPAALGGTGMRSHTSYPGTWAVGLRPEGVPHLLDLAVALLRDALVAAGPGARVAAVLWHQGESDGQHARTEEAYAADLDALVAHLRAAVPAAAHAPFLVGGLAAERLAAYPTHAGVEAALRATPDRVPRSAYAPAPPPGYVNDGTTHLTAAGQRLLGEAYADAFERLEAEDTGGAGVETSGAPAGADASS